MSIFQKFKDKLQGPPAFSWNTAFEQRVKMGKQSYQAECKKWVASCAAENSGKPNVSPRKEEKTGDSTAVIKENPALPMLEMRDDVLDVDEFRNNSEELHQALFKALQILLHPGWSQPVLNKAWEQFDSEGDGFIDADQNDKLIGSYLTSFSFHFPKYVEALYDLYKNARLTVQRARLAAEEKVKKRAAEYEDADAHVIRMLRSDSLLSGQQSHVTIKGGIEEDNSDVIRMLSDGIDDERDMRLANLEKAQSLVMLHCSEIAHEAFRLMRISSSAKIARWEMLECFNLAINTAQELILLRAEAESNPKHADAAPISMQESIKTVAARNASTRSASTTERRSSRDPRVSIVHDNQAFLAPKNNSIKEKDKMKTDEADADSMVILDTLELRLATRKFELKEKQRASEAKQTKTLQGLGFM